MSPELHDLPDHHDFTPYKAKKGEEYMNPEQEAHFLNILNGEFGYGYSPIWNEIDITFTLQLLKGFPEGGGFFPPGD